MAQRHSFCTLAVSLALLAASAIVPGCTNRAGGASPATGYVRHTGAVRLQVPSGDLTLSSMDYSITGPGGYAQTGAIDLSHSTTVSVVVASIPAGAGYKVSLTGTASDGSTTCAGSADFAITAGTTSSVSVHIACQQPARTGDVAITGTINICPVIDGLSASPAEVTVGGALILGASVHDTDGAPAPLAYRWSASAGTLSDATAASPAFTCSSIGPSTITLTLSDGDPSPGCAASDSFTVDCSAAFQLVASPADLAPGQSASLRLVATDGAAHNGATYSWTDGLDTFQTGLFAPSWISATNTVAYTPSSCNALGGGDHALAIAATISDPALESASSATAWLTVHCPPAYYTTKTPYQPFQEPAAASAPPPGFSPVFTELVARHGSRGLSSLKYDAAALAMWQQAAADGALTSLGASLGPDLQKMMRGNALLGYGVAGISTPGYGNLTQIGIHEQQQLAARLLQRLPDYFSGLAATAGTAAPRQIIVVSSGVDRAVDSAAFFTGSLASNDPAIAPLLTPTPALTAYPANKPAPQAIGTNRFLLYFHKLAAKTDLVTDPTDPYFQTYQDSLAYQAFAADPDMNAKVASVLADPSVTAAARAVLLTLFTPDFVNKLDTGVYTFANTGTFTFTSDDGLFTTTLIGDGKTTVKSLADAASMLYNVYVVAPAMVNEIGVDFTKYIPPAQAAVLAYLQDAQDFYQMGPSIAESNPVTYRMAQALENDFFTEIDAIAGGDLSHGAKLRFTHAEIIVPFANLLGLDGAATATPKASTYTYADNPWRGQVVSSMATNQQWDVFRDGSGTLLVRLLYDEKEIDFKPSCNSARYLPGTHFYEYHALKACYGR